MKIPQLSDKWVAYSLIVVMISLSIALSAIGFGFVEVGTETPRPQEDDKAMEELMSICKGVLTLSITKNHDGTINHSVSCAVAIE